MAVGKKSRWSIPDRTPSRPDGLIVLSYALKDSVEPTRPTRAEIEQAVDWWRRFPEAHIVMSTGDNQKLGITNARVMVEYAMRLGVPRDRLIEEDRSKDTRENLLYSMRIVEREHWQQPTLVTLDLYTPRAVATAKKLGWRDFYWLSVYAEGEAAFGTKRFQTRTRRTILAYEIGAMAFSKLLGWV